LREAAAALGIEPPPFKKQQGVSPDTYTPRSTV